jgi:hypothetical protein
MKLILFLSMLWSSCFSQIPNPSFENWTTAFGGDQPFPWFIFPAECFGCFFGEKSTDSHSGQYAVKMKTRIINGTTNSMPLYSGSDTYPYFPIATKINSVTAWIKLNNNSIDTLKCNIVCRNSSVTIGGVTSLVATAQTSYIQYTFPITYSSNLTPDEMSIVFNWLRPKDPSSFYIVDDLATSPAVSINEIPNCALSHIYVANGELILSETCAKDIELVSLISFTGTALRNWKAPPYSLSDVPKGIYLTSITTLDKVSVYSKVVWMD